MNRCASLLVTLALAATLAPTSAQGTLQRNFSQAALRGRMAFGTPPAITLNRQPATLAVGARIHGQNNLLVLSGTLSGLTAEVDYTTDLEGQVRVVWILTDAEAANKPWPRTPAEAAAWTFDPVAQTWTKP